MRLSLTTVLVFGSFLLSNFAHALAIDLHAPDVVARELSSEFLGSFSIQARAVQKVVIKQKTVIKNPEGPVVVNQNAVVDQYQTTQASAPDGSGIPDCPQIQKVVVKQKVKVINAKGDVNVKQNIAVNQEQTKQSAPGSKRAESPATEELIEDDSEAAYSGTTEAEDPKRRKKCRKQVQKVVVVQIVRIKNPQDTVDVKQNVDINQVQEQKASSPPVVVKAT